MRKIENAFNILQIKESELKTIFKQLTGIRKIFQFEARDYTVCISKTMKPDIYAYGITNRCQDGLFVFFAEYDKIYKSLMYKDLNLLIEKFSDQFTNFYIAGTEPETKLLNGKIKGSYHVVCFKKFYKNEIDEFLKLCNVDSDYLKIPKKTAHKTHVLRISEKIWKENNNVQKEKPFFLEIYPKKQLNPNQTISAPHYRYFKTKWGFSDPFEWQTDNNKIIELHKYATITRGKKNAFQKKRK